jgi:diguanylate cyclase (GGDEF)-like protein
MSSGLDDAVEVAERIRERVERECSPEYDPSLVRAITVSLGVAALTESVSTLDQLVRRADVEMYRAKQARTGYLSRAQFHPAAFRFCVIESDGSPEAKEKILSVC